MYHKEHLYYILALGPIYFCIERCIYMFNRYMTFLLRAPFDLRVPFVLTQVRVGKSIHNSMRKLHFMFVIREF